MLHGLLHVGEGGYGLQAEHFDEAARFAPEKKARLHHPGVVEHEHGPGGQQAGQVGKIPVADLPALVGKQAGGGPVGQGEFGDPLLRQGIGEIFDL